MILTIFSLNDYRGEIFKRVISKQIFYMLIAKIEYVIII
jgi:hypothetical protein